MSPMHGETLCVTGIDITTEAPRKVACIVSVTSQKCDILRNTLYQPPEKTEAQLRNPTTDDISSVKLGSVSSEFLLVISLDCVRLYDTVNASKIHRQLE